MRTQSRFRGFVLAATVFGSLALASCSTSSPTSSEAPSAQTKPYGTLTVGGQFGTGHLDPLIASSGTFGSIGRIVFDVLVEYSDDDKPVPGLAERWEISSDGMSHTFYIRKGVKFHNGDDLTGADVKFSIERMLAPDSTSTTDTATWRGAVAGIDLKDDYTVVLRMKQPQFDRLRGIEGSMASVVPKKYIEEKGVEYFRRNLVGSGPWKLLKFEPGTRLEAEAVESHWRAVPKFKNLTLMSVPEESTAVSMLKTGELDMALVSPDSVPTLKAAGVRVIAFDRGTNYYGQAFYDYDNPQKHALGDVRVRKAAQLAINQQELADKLVSGNGGPIIMAFVFPTAYFWDANQLKLDPYDPEGAKKLMAEAGFPNGFGTKLWDVGAGSLLSTIDQAVAGYWRKVGINAETVAMEFSSFRPNYAPKTNPDIYNTLWIYRMNGYRDFDGVTSTYHSTKGPGQNLKVPRLDELIDKVPTMPMSDDKKRLALEAVVIGKNIYSRLSVVGVYPTMGVSSKVGNVPRRPVAEIFGYTYEGVTHAK